MLQVSAAIVTYQGKILLFLRDDKPNLNDPNCWSLIGGHFEEDENSDQALIREVQEEINITPTDFKLLFDLIGTRGEQDFIYHIKLTDKQAKNIKLGDEGQKIEFKTPAEMKNLPLTQNLEKLLKDRPEIFEKALKT